MNALIEQTIKKISPLDESVISRVQKKLDNLTKPQGSLGKLEALAKQIAGITGSEKPVLEKKLIFTFAGDHGVTEEGVSAYPQEVTAQMVHNFLRGGAAINVLARHIGAKVIVIDMGIAGELKGRVQDNPDFRDLKIASGTKNMAKRGAMRKAEAEDSICAGIELMQSEKENADIIGIGDMGIGNTTASSAILAAITKEDVSKLTGRGTGIDDGTFRKKTQTIQRALTVNSPVPDDPLDVLSKVGGFEIGGACGAIIAAASCRKPIVIDGFISGAAALIASELAPSVKPYLIASHLSAELGHRIMLERMGLDPLLDLDLRLGEGTGATLGIFLCEAGVKILTQMATFEEAHVSEKK